MAGIRLVDSGADTIGLWLVDNLCTSHIFGTRIAYNMLFTCFQEPVVSISGKGHPCFILCISLFFKVERYFLFVWGVNIT